MARTLGGRDRGGIGDGGEIGGERRVRNRKKRRDREGRGQDRNAKATRSRQKFD